MIFSFYFLNVQRALSMLKDSGDADIFRCVFVLLKFFFVIKIKNKPCQL